MSNLYEFVRYPGKPVPQSHPDRLATIATLLGLEPRDITAARILEIGCCDNGNLIPMAMALPQSEFVGIDLTASDVACAKETVSTLSLANAAFHVYDLMAVVKASLSPRGVAYVSFNAMPGGHVRLMVREMIFFHVREIHEPAQRISAAREFLQFLKPTLEKNSALKLFLFEIDRILGLPDHALFHDAFVFFSDLPEADTETDRVCDILLTLLKTGLVSAHVHSPAFTKPCATSETVFY